MSPSDPSVPTAGDAESQAPRRALHRWLLVLPFVWQVAAVPWANAVKPTILSMPFLMVWQMAGVLFSSLVIAIVYHLDRKQAVAR